MRRGANVSGSRIASISDGKSTKDVPNAVHSLTLASDSMGQRPP